jgi:hypothetical protein
MLRVIRNASGLRAIADGRPSLQPSWRLFPLDQGDPKGTAHNIQLAQSRIPYSEVVEVGVLDRNVHGLIAVRLWMLEHQPESKLAVISHDPHVGVYFRGHALRLSLEEFVAWGQP